MENYTGIYYILEMRVKILQIHKKVIHWLFKDFNVFLLLWFSYLGSQWRLKTVFCFSVQTQFLLEHPSLGIIEFVLPLQRSLVRASPVANSGQYCFSCGFILIRKISAIQEEDIFFLLIEARLKLLELPTDQIPLIKYIWRFMCQGSQRLRCHWVT